MLTTIPWDYNLAFGGFQSSDATSSVNTAIDYSSTVTPVYRHPKKNWRLKRGATPQWYKSRNGVRTKALSGAARVARYRPHKP